MGSYYEDLAVVIQTYRQRYATAYDHDEFIRASKWLYLMNTAHPSKAFINNMPRFALRSTDGLLAIRTRLNKEQKAQAYCDYWDWQLELAMTDFRETNQEKWNRV